MSDISHNTISRSSGLVCERMARFSMFFSPRSFTYVLMRISLLTVLLGLVAYKVGFIPLQGTVRKTINYPHYVDQMKWPRLTNAGQTVNKLYIVSEQTRGKINTSKPTCIFPKLELHDQEIMKFFVKHPRRDCPVEADWMIIKKGMFIITEAAVKSHPNIRCDAYPIVKVTDFRTAELAPIKDVRNTSLITNDFYRVECTSSDGHKYSNYLAGIRHDREVHKRQASKHVDGLGLDVVMLGLDSTSRLAWIRHLPKSRDYFINVLKGTEMEGYNILGDGTPAAIMPILIGYREEELHEARKGQPNAKPVDDFPWIWNEFQAAGYVSAWAEDDAALGTFQYRLLGFQNQPTDHYFRYFCVAAEPNYQNFVEECMGSRPRHSVVLDYMNEMFGMYPDRRKWMFSFQAQLSHRDNNLLSKMDDDLLEHLMRMHRGKSLDNAVFIMMADHGGRFNKVRATAQGKQEERLPYLGIRFPEWFHEKYPQIIKNIQTNSQRLTTPFDIHETLHEILNYTGAGIANISNRGVSLFKEIPIERDCKAAQVDPHWCSCLDWQKVDLKSDIIKQVAKTVIDNLNNYTVHYRNLCSLLSLDKVESATSFQVSDAVLKFKDTIDGGRGRFGSMTDTTKHSKILYQVTLFTHPGGGRFEVTVTYIVGTELILLDRTDISRTNQYGSQPWCVEKTDASLRPFCYCKSPPPA